ncbi:hypothetical protein D9M71_734720 [compost metagenome]
MGGGDILTLQRILGHSSINMTMRYAHLSPDHLESAMRLSPLAQLHQQDLRTEDSGQPNEREGFGSRIQSRFASIGGADIGLPDAGAIERHL